LTRNRGFTLLEMIVATTIMAIAIVGLLSGISSATRNAARLRDYDRMTQLARLRMNELVADRRLPHDTVLNGAFPPALAGGLNAAWRARLSTLETSPRQVPGELAVDRIELEVSWMYGAQRKSFSIEGYRRRALRPEDIAPAGAPK
jgi:general secretion pathway protein I